ncbi:unnamed protein product, partial [marine sediment metagenome]
VLEVVLPRPADDYLAFVPPASGRAAIARAGSGRGTG